MNGVPSGNVDERIVEMRIDQEKFESGAKKTIDILEKLDNGLKSLGKNNVDGFDSVGDSLDKVTHRFSALGIAGDQIIRRLTDKTMELVGQLGRLSTALSIDQISVGWGKYAEKTQGVQTIMAATAKDWDDQGAQIEWVNSQLQKLNLFTDETSYNFLDMVNNIGKFTSNGVKLETAVTAMEGISNWAAISGGTINEAGRAMYNLSQALATGSVKLIDWKSIENANMATREFKETALETAVALGTLTKSGNKFITQTGKEFTTEQFNTQLSEGWFSSDVLLQTLQIYGSFTDVLLETSEATGETVTEILNMIDAYKEGKDVTAEMLPYIKELAKDEYDLGRRAFKAAQEAKTFQEAIDATKDAVSTGWMNLFETMFGNYLTAKSFWTKVANSLYDIFAEPVNRLNEIFDLAFNGPNPLKDYIADAGYSMADLEAAAAKAENVGLLSSDGANLPTGIKQLIEDCGSLENAIRAGKLSAEELQWVFDQMNIDRIEGITNGKNEAFNSELERIQAFARDLALGQINEEAVKKAGVNLEMVKWWSALYKTTMNTMKEIGPKSGSGKENEHNFYLRLRRVDELAQEEIDKLVKKYGSLDEAVKAGAVAASEEMLNRNYLKQFADKFGEDAMLKLAGYTDDEIAKIHELGLSVDDVLDAMRDPKVLRAEGFKLFTESITNLLNTFAKLGEAADSALSIIFGGSADEEGAAIANETLAEKLYGLIERFHKFTQSLEITDKKMEELKQKFVNFFSTFGSAKGILNSITGIFKTIGSWILNILAVIWNSGIIRGVIQGLLIVLQALLIPIGLIIEGVTTLIGKGRDLAEQEWAKALSGWFGVVAEKVLSAANAFKEFMSSSKVATFVASALNTIANIAGKIATAFDKLWKRVKEFAKMLKEEFNANGILGVFTLLGTTISNKLTKIFDDLKKRLNKEGIKGLFKGLLDSIIKFFSEKASISTVTASIGTFFGNIFEKIGTFLYGKVNKDKIAGFTKSVQDFFSKAFGKVGEFLSKKIDFTKLGAFFTGLGEAFKGGLAKIGQFISKNFNFKKIGDFIGSFLAMLGELAKNAYPIIRYGALIVIFINIAKWSWVLSDTVWSISDFAEGASRIGLAGVLGSIAALVLAISAAVALFALIPKDKLLPALGALVVITLFAVGLTFIVIRLISVLEKLIPNTWIAVAKLYALTPIMLSLGLSVLMIVGALAALAYMDTAKLIKGLAALTVLLLEIMAFMFSIAVSSRIAGAGHLKDLLYLALGIWLIGKTLMNLSKLSIGQILKGWLGIRLIMGQIIRFTRRSGVFEDSDRAILKSLIGLAVGVWLMGKTLKNLGNLSVGQILKGWFGLARVMGQIIRFTRRSRTINGRQLWGLIGLAASIAIIANSFKKLGDMTIGEIIKAWIATFALIGQLVRVMNASINRRTGKSINGKHLLGLLAIALAVATLAEVMVRLGKVPFRQLVKGGLALGGIMSALGLMMRNAAPLFGGHVKGQGWKNLITCLGIIGIIATSAYALKKLSDIPSKKLFSAAGALSMTLVAIAGAMAIVSRLGGGFNVGGAASLIVGILALWGIGEILIRFGEANVNWARIVQAVIVCVGAMVAIAGAMWIVGNIPTGAALRGVVGIGLIAAAIEAVILILLGIGLVVVGTAIAMAERLTAFTTALSPFLEAVRGYDESTVASLQRFAEMMGLLALAEVFELVGATLNAIITYLIPGDLKDAIGRLRTLAIKISSLCGFIKSIPEDAEAAFGRFIALLAILDVAEVLELVGDFLNCIIEFIPGDLSDSIGRLRTLAIRISSLCGFIDMIPEGAEEKFLRFSTILGEVALIQGIEAIGELINLIVTAIPGEFSDAFDRLAALANAIRDKLLPSIGRLKPIHATQVNTFADIMLALTKVEAWEVIGKLLNALGNGIDKIGTNKETGEKLGPSFTENLVTLVNGIKEFADVLSAEDFPNLDDVKGKVESFAGIIELLTQVEKWDVINKLMTAVGNKWGSDYTENLVALPGVVREFVNAIVGTKEDDDNGWGSIGDEAKKKVENFAGIMSAIGGITKAHNIARLFQTLGDIAGTGYSADLVALPGTVRDFVDEIVKQNFSDDYPQKIQTFSDVMGTIVEITGLQTVADILAKLGANAPLSSARLEAFTRHIGAFLTNIEVLDENSPAKVDQLNTFMQRFTSSNFVASWNEFVSAAGEVIGSQFFHYTDAAGNDISKFQVLAQQLDEFGGAIKPFLDLMAEIDIANIVKAERVFTALDFVGSHSTFTNFMDDAQNILAFDIFGQDEAEIQEKLGKIQTLTEFLNSLLGFSDTMRLLNGENGTEGASSFGSDLITSISSGVSSNQDNLKGAIEVAVRAAISNAKTDAVSENAMSVGTYIVTGIKNGLANSTYIATYAAAALARDILQAAKDALGIASPSKAFAALAAFIPAGVAKGVRDNIGVAEESMAFMGNSVLDAMQQAMLNVATVADDSFEFNPMITPVVDMSNVSYAASGVQGMFGSVGAALRASTSVSMDTAQNTAAAVTYDRGNEGVVSELQRMGSRLDRLGEAVTNMKIVLDSGELVGATAGRMDDAFGVREMHSRRGN